MGATVYSVFEDRLAVFSGYSLVRFGQLVSIYLRVPVYALVAAFYQHPLTSLSLGTNGSCSAYSFC